MESCCSFICVYVPGAGVPGHQFFRFLMGRRLAEVGQHAQHQKKIFIGLNSVGFGRFYRGAEIAVEIGGRQYHPIGILWFVRQIVGNQGKVMQDTLGHVDISTTLNIYADVTKELKKDEFEGLDCFFKERKNEKNSKVTGEKKVASALHDGTNDF